MEVLCELSKGYKDKWSSSNLDDDSFNTSVFEEIFRSVLKKKEEELKEKKFKKLIVYLYDLFLQNKVQTLNHCALNVLKTDFPDIMGKIICAFDNDKNKNSRLVNWMHKNIKEGLLYKWSKRIFEIFKDSKIKLLGGGEVILFGLSCLEELAGDENENFNFEEKLAKFRQKKSGIRQGSSVSGEVKNFSFGSDGWGHVDYSGGSQELTAMHQNLGSIHSSGNDSGIRAQNRSGHNPNHLSHPSRDEASTVATLNRNSVQG